MAALFITFEGIDGAGKSTHLGRLRTRLTTLGYPVVATREPGGTAVGDAIRAMLLDGRQSALSPRTEALLYAASRAQLLHEVVRPALAGGKIVLCDRYVDASVAYQGAGLGIGVDAVRQMNDFATERLQPDLTFLFHIPVEESRRRVHAVRSSGGPDRIERRDSAYFGTVSRTLLAIAAAEPSRVVVLNADRPSAEVEQEIWRHTAKLLESTDTPHK